jgi:hypothetical protein
MKVRLLLLIALLGFMLNGCIFNHKTPYEFRQEFDQIACIEILKKQYDSIRTDTPMDVIKTIDPTEHRALIDALLETDGSRVGLDPPTGFGMYIIRITYLDGEMEMIGNYSNGYITPDGKLHEDIYCFDREQYYAVISDYLGEEVIWPTAG